MSDTFAVKVLKTSQDLREVVSDTLLAEQLVLGDELVEITAFRILHNQV
jgi:hypothetical protein